MYRTLLKSKLHRAVVTEACLDYVGSITIDEQLMESADLYLHEKVQIVNINNGARFETYVISGPRSSGTICINGAAARLAQPGDRIIIMSYALVENSAAGRHRPVVVLLDDQNKIIQAPAAERPGDKF